MKKVKFSDITFYLFNLFLLPLVWATEKNKEVDQTQDNSIAEFFMFSYDQKEAEKSGVIIPEKNEPKPEEIPHEILTAIKENPGLETGQGFRAPLSFPSTDTGCQLFGLNMQLSDKANTKQWLVVPLPPCGKHKYAPLNSPFWLVEQEKDDIPKVLLAYRAYTLSILNQKHREYADISITYQSPLDGNDISVTWRYQGQEYAYHASICSNLNPIDADEPAFFTDCAPVERWSAQAERETGS